MADWVMNRIGDNGFRALRLLGGRKTACDLVVVVACASLVSFVLVVLGAGQAAYAQRGLAAAPGKENVPGQLTVAAQLAIGSPPIKHGLIWRVFQPLAEGAKLVRSSRAPAPTFRLPAGRYIVNAAYGRAFLTRVISVSSGQTAIEKFVLNAGGLKVQATLANGAPVTPGSVTYDIFSDERDQNGNRVRILGDVRPGVVVRLNSGIYQLVSKMGDANARVTAEVTVEAGKLTEATFAHDAGKCTFKLVRQPGGEALADVQWTILNSAGAIVKESAGALPTHILAPGNYTVSARFADALYTRTFEIRSGDNVEVEVVIK
jgi:hypothetical protein